MAETQNQEEKKKLAVNKRNPIEMGINNNKKKIKKNTSCRVGFYE